MKLPQDNLNYPIKILVGESSGSCFLIRHQNDIFLVTAKHVLFRKTENLAAQVLISNDAQIVCYPKTPTGVAENPRLYSLNLLALVESGDLKVHTTKDLVVIKIGSVVVTEVGTTLNIVDHITVTQDSAGDLIWYDMVNSRRLVDVEVTNTVFVLGYPISLSTPEMQQIDYDAPLARKGIVAGKNIRNQTVILDCPVYGGNSGGLVLEINNNSIHLIGVVVQFIPFVEQWRNTRFPELQNTSQQNSGYSVALPVDNIFDLIEHIEEDN